MKKKNTFKAAKKGEKETYLISLGDLGIPDQRYMEILYIKSELIGQ